tara:strand:- start:1205 stop:1453 length:249 start_codon:yes stop_codon:yes gene_type:complete
LTQERTIDINDVQKIKNKLNIIRQSPGNISGTYRIKYNGICPIHNYRHKNNNSLYQTRHALICVKDNSKLKLAVNVKEEQKK